MGVDGAAGFGKPRTSFGERKCNRPRKIRVLQRGVWRTKWQP